MKKDTQLRRSKLALTLCAALISTSLDASKTVDLGNAGMTYGTIYSTYLACFVSDSITHTKGVDNQKFIYSLKIMPMSTTFQHLKFFTDPKPTQVAIFLGIILMCAATAALRMPICTLISRINAVSLIPKSFNHKLRSVFCAISLTCLCLQAQSQVTISLGNPPASLDTVNTDFPTYTHLPTSINLVGVANNIAVLTFPAVDITGFVSLSMRASVTNTMAEPNPNVYALVEIFDSSNNVLAFDTFTNLYGTSPTDVVLTFNSSLSSPSFNYNNVVAFQFTGGGIGTQPLNITIHQLDAYLIPEPSIVVFLLFFVAFFVISIRRLAHLKKRQKPCSNKLGFKRR